MKTTEVRPEAFALDLLLFVLSDRCHVTLRPVRNSPDTTHSNDTAPSLLRVSSVPRYRAPKPGTARWSQDGEAGEHSKGGGEELEQYSATTSRNNEGSVGPGHFPPTRSFW